jgi:NAD(P)-dependent dehydrogenase (short-subunit alcohol dehydrogenase family)
VEETMSFEDTVVLVTGAASGIGLDTARTFAREGATVILSDIQHEKGEQAADELKSKGLAAEFIHCDISDVDSIDKLFESIKENHGRLDVAFNNAGIEGNMGPLDSLTLDDWNRVISINLTSVFRCMQHQITMMREAGSGVIINCSSIAGLVGTQGGGIYCASKHGVIGLTKAAALDLASENIRVNAICPGAIDTAMVQRAISANPGVKSIIESQQPIGRMGTVEEISAAVLWLSRPESALVTGMALPLDGGWTAK